jgi:hypothetical protein
MDDAAVQAAPSRQAIGAEAPRLPAPAPQAPPQEAHKPAVTVQAPVQRPAPAPAGQAARSGVPNGAKQPANGKAQDDEDWWTE